VETDTACRWAGGQLPPQNPQRLCISGDLFRSEILLGSLRLLVRTIGQEAQGRP